MSRELNKSQLLAVHHYRGPALVVAGPGSGKTKVLTHRIAYLLQKENVESSRLLCVTFTNKAAKEINERVQKLLGSKDTPTWSGTFHSICARILRKEAKSSGIQSNYVIYDTDDQESLIKSVIKDFGIDSKKFSPRMVLSNISSAKSELVSPEEYADVAFGYIPRTISKIYPEYQKRLRTNNALDFDDLIMETVNLFKNSPESLHKYQTIFSFILIDEYQDTNKAQYTLTKLLAQSHRNLFVVGDMSQAIYSFRGADFRNILNFQKDYPDATVYNLDQNYRSTQTILDAAKNVIKNNTTHIPLELWTENGSGDKITIYTAESEKLEAHYVVEKVSEELSFGKKYKEIAVLYRTNAQSRTIEEGLIRANIPYKIVDGVRFYSRKEIKDIIGFLRVIHNSKDSVSWERVINVPPRGIGQKALQEIKDSDWNLELIEKKTKLPIQKWLKVSESLSTLELMDVVIEDTGYVRWLSDGSEENKSRVENINELRSVATQFISLPEFLENVALIESPDKPSSETYNAITLMTIHSAKGLEFPVIFIVGMEEGLFPHSQSLGEKDDLEEERRLCYVALTRAMTRVYMTNTRLRLYFGTTQANMPSRFIDEIPSELVDLQGSIFSGIFGQTQEEGYFSKVTGQYISGLPGQRKAYRKPPKDDFDDFSDEARKNFSWDD